MPKIIGYAKKFKVIDGDKDKINKLTPFCIDDEKLLEKCKANWTKIEDLENIKLNALPIYDDIKTKIRTYVDNVYTNVRGLMCQKMIQNTTLLQSFLLIFYLYMKTNIICKHI